MHLFAACLDANPDSPAPHTPPPPGAVSPPAERAVVDLRPFGRVVLGPFLSRRAAAWAAHVVAVRWARDGWRDGWRDGPRGVLRQLHAAGVIPAVPLPAGVRRVARGRKAWYRGRAGVGGVAVRTGRFRCPWACGRALAELARRERARQVGGGPPGYLDPLTGRVLLGVRVRRCPSRFEYVRRVARGWQARPWVAQPWYPAGRGVNLGYFSDSEHGADAEWAAGRAARAFVEILDPPKGSRYVGWLQAKGLRPGPAAVAAAVKELQARGFVPACVAPPAEAVAAG